MVVRIFWQYHRQSIENMASVHKMDRIEKQLLCKQVVHAFLSDVPSNFSLCDYIYDVCGHMCVCRCYFPSKAIPQYFTLLSSLHQLCRKIKSWLGKKKQKNDESSSPGFLSQVAQERNHIFCYANTENNAQYQVFIKYHLIILTDCLLKIVNKIFLLLKQLEIARENFFFAFVFSSGKISQIHIKMTNINSCPPIALKQ